MASRARTWRPPRGRSSARHRCRASREKGGGSVDYDLRPLLIALSRRGDGPGPPVVVRARTRFHPSLGTGRPEEVVAALADVLGRPLTASTIVRERLLLADELEIVCARRLTVRPFDR